MARSTICGNTADTSRVARGIICAIVGGSLWGFSGSCAQFLISDYGMSPLAITSVRMIGAGVLFLVYLLLRDRVRLTALLHDGRSLAQVAVFGIAGLYLSQLTYTIVIGYTNAGTATVLQCTNIIFVMAATCVLCRRLPRAAEIAGLVLAAAATWLIATNGDPTRIVLPVPGLVWGLANGITVAFYILYPRRVLEKWGSLAVTGCGMLIGGIVATCVAAPQSTLPSLDVAGWLALAAIVVLGTCASFGLYLQGVKDAGAVRASMLGVSEPVAATLISWLWLGTSFTLFDLAGFALMIAMVLVVTKSEGAQ